ncbi:MAG: CRTAC1 family protein [Planctomycetota bacterium]|nr:CRTAC1 family protein [Planctomycetota bacterium]
MSLVSESLLRGVACAAAIAVMPAQTFVDVTAPSGLAAVSPSVGAYGIGACCADFDGDGDLDVVVPLGAGQAVQLYWNQGGMTFAPAGNLGIAYAPHAIVAADVDNDGDQDILLANSNLPLQLFINDGAGGFVEDAQARGLTSAANTYGVSFGDYDRDGWLDIYLANRDGLNGLAQDNVLYRNIGGGAFVDVTAAAGASNFGLTCAAAFCDFNEDSWPDIICCNDKGYLYLPNALLQNNGDGTFTDVADPMSAAAAIDCMGVDFVDAFNDGGVDLYLSDTMPDHLFLRWDPGLSRFVDDTYTYGLQGQAIGWAVNWLDVHNDGWQDLHVVQSFAPNALYENPGAPASAQAPWPNGAIARGLGVAFPQHTALIADFDDDGGVDVLNRYTAHPNYSFQAGFGVYRNDLQRGNWLRVDPRGVASNRDGLGAHVEVVVGSQRQRQHVRSGAGYLSGVDRRVHFGVGGAVIVDEVTVTWPSGQVQRLESVPVNQTLRVTEPSLSLAAPAAAGGVTSLDLSIQGDEGAVYLMLVAFGDTPGIGLPDGRLVPVNFDPLASFTLSPGNVILPNSIGFLDAAGHASSPLQLPALPGLAGTDLYATAVTLDQPGSLVIDTVFPRALRFTVQ